MQRTRCFKSKNIHQTKANLWQQTELLYITKCKMYAKLENMNACNIAYMIGYVISDMKKFCRKNTMFYAKKLVKFQMVR